MERLPMSWWRDLKKEVKFCEPLSKHTTLRVGGIADIWFEPHNLKSLKKILNSSRKKGIPFLVIGNGSKLLVRESGVRGVVAHLNSPYFKKLNFSNSSLTAGCGVSLEKLVNLSRQKGLGGCEFLTGIPGTVGGALITNAGVRDVFCEKKKRLRYPKGHKYSIGHKSIGDIVEEVTVIDPQGILRNLKREKMRFGYRHSNLDKFIILKVKFKLKRKKLKEIDSAINKFMKHKKATQELIKPNAGCIFKNPYNRSAARLIDLCGLKEYRVGGAQISTKHANFIINRANAQARDVLALIKLVQDRVKAKYATELKTEIRIIGE